MKNKSLKTLFVYNGIFVLAATMLGPLYAIYVVEFVDGISAVSVSWATFLVSTSFFMFLVSKCGDKIKEKEYLLLAGYLIRIISWILMIFVGNILMLIFVQILLGLGEALGTPSFNAIFAKHLDKNMYVNEYSNLSLIMNLSAALGILIGGFVVNSFGFKILFVLMALLATVSFFGILLKPRKLL